MLRRWRWCWTACKLLAALWHSRRLAPLTAPGSWCRPWNQLGTSRQTEWPSSSWSWRLRHWRPWGRHHLAREDSKTCTCQVLRHTEKLLGLQNEYNKFSLSRAKFTLTSWLLFSKQLLASSLTDNCSWKALSAEMIGAYVVNGKWIRGYGTKFVWNSFKSTFSAPSKRSEAEKVLNLVF